jgi:hypothetical protein
LTKKGKNGLIERVIENWLTNSNEIGYQVPFCQYLISEGSTVLHLSSHGQMEQGKDIISIDRQGQPCAYQLKAGDIDLTEWRTIKGEIDDLIEIPINYPGIDKNTQHRAILVTNGKISDPVKQVIHDLNPVNIRRGFTKLEIITKMDLLKRFLKVHNVFLPREPSDFKLFLELLLTNGKDQLDKEKTAKFIESILFTGKETRQELKRKIASGLLLTKYLVKPFEETNNHISIIEAWTLFGSYILAMVEKYSLENKYWGQSFDLVSHLINSQFDLLKTEFFSRTNYLEGSWDGALIYRSRLTNVLGWLSAYELFRKHGNNTYAVDDRIFQYIKNYRKDGIWFWGETATPCFIEMSLIGYQSGDTTFSNNLLIDLVAKIMVDNLSNEGKGLPNPYYSVEQVLQYAYGFRGKEIVDDSFLGSSYHVSTIIDMLVRRNARTSLNVVWKDASKLLLCEFKPTEKWQFLVWSCDKGDQIELFYDHPQSWKKLIDEASDYEMRELPKSLINNPFSHLFLMCFPHRLTRESVKLIDKK